MPQHPGMRAVTPKRFKSERGKRRQEPQWPAEKVPGKKSIDADKSRMAPMRTTLAERRRDESDCMVNRGAQK